MRLAFAVALVLGCGDTTETTVSQLNLDRPTGITFACMGGLRLIPDDRADQTMASIDDEVVLSAMPTTACEVRSGIHDTADPAPVPAGQEDLTQQGGVSLGSVSWFAFILQTAPGTVALAQFATKPSTSFAGGDISVLDAAPLTPGKNAISVGEEPIAIATDRSGCKVVTANAGSCDISVLDVASAVDLDPATAIDVRRFEVTTASGVPLRAKPAAMVVEPASTTIGKACPATPTGAEGIVYVAYPGCRLVAAVEVATARVVGGVRFDDAGLPAILQTAELATLTCPDECSAEPRQLGVHPVALDLEHDARTARRRLAIGADNSSSITVVDLSATTSLPEAIVQVALEDPTGTLGVRHLALTPQIGMGGELHTIADELAPGGQSQFVYAIATDSTVRVVDVLDLGRECDTQVDSRFLRDITDVRLLACLPVGDPRTPPRRAGARGPGIQLIGDGVPLSVDIIRSDAIESDTRLENDPERLIGYFAIIGASNGGVFVVDIDDDDRRDLFSPLRPLLTQMPLLIAHQLRDAITDRGALAQQEDDGVITPLCEVDAPDADAVTGGPRSTDDPVRNFGTDFVSSTKVFTLPGFRRLLCTGSDSDRAVYETSFAAPEEIRDHTFPDLAAVAPSETWTMTWEGTLSVDGASTAVDGPVVREGEIRVDGSGMHVVDPAQPFCRAGVEPYDIVQLRGCDPANGNLDCPTGYRCFVHPDSEVSSLGACLLEDEADRLVETCGPFLTSLRRYTVASAESGRVRLLPRRHTLRTTPVDGCVDDAQCETLADLVARDANDVHPSFDTTSPDPLAWSCVADPDRPAISTGKRCQLRCTSNDQCASGTVCQAGFCMEGVLPPQACVNAPQRYQLQAGEAFAVLGTRSGFLHPIITDASGRCVRDPTANELLVGRIPLDPPACDPTADPITGRRADGTLDPNPCALTVETTDVAPIYEADCVADDSEFRQREAPAIRFRNRSFGITLIDPTYPGDAECILDRGGALGRIPHVYSGYQLGFDQTAGLVPLGLGVTAVLPVAVVRGPTQSIWVIDEGDFLSTSSSVASTRGKVFRVESTALTLINVLE